MIGFQVVEEVAVGCVSCLFYDADCFLGHGVHSGEQGGHTVEFCEVEYTSSRYEGYSDKPSRINGRNIFGKILDFGDSKW